jgi:hypothetical protein
MYRLNHEGEGNKRATYNVNSNELLTVKPDPSSLIPFTLMMRAMKLVTANIVSDWLIRFALMREAVELVTANVFPGSLILFRLMMEEIYSCETYLLTRATRHHIPGEGNPHSHCRQNIKANILWFFSSELTTPHSIACI